MSKQVTMWIAVLNNDYGRKDMEVECFSVEVIETAKQYRLVESDSDQFHRAQQLLRFYNVHPKGSLCKLHATAGEAINALDDRCAEIAEAASREADKAWTNLGLTHEALREYNDSRTT